MVIERQIVAKTKPSIQAFLIRKELYAKVIRFIIFIRRIRRAVRKGSIVSGPREVNVAAVAHGISTFDQF
jgi:hypothetical protein